MSGRMAVDAVEHPSVSVRVRVERGPESLGAGHSAGLRHPYAPAATRTSSKLREPGANERSQHLAREPGLVRTAVEEGVGKRQHPLPGRDCGQHPIGPVRRARRLGRSRSPALHAGTRRAAARLEGPEPRAHLEDRVSIAPRGPGNGPCRVTGGAERPEDRSPTLRGRRVRRHTSAMARPATPTPARRRARGAGPTPSSGPSTWTSFGALAAACRGVSSRPWRPRKSGDALSSASSSRNGAHPDSGSGPKDAGADMQGTWLFEASKKRLETGRAPGVP